MTINQPRSLRKQAIQTLDKIINDDEIGRLGKRKVRFYQNVDSRKPLVRKSKQLVILRTMVY